MTDTPAAAHFRQVGHRAVDAIVDAWPTKGRAMVEYWYLPGAASELLDGPATARWIEITRRKLDHKVAVDATPDDAPAEKRR